MGPDQPLKICWLDLSNKGLVENISYNFVIFQIKNHIFKNSKEQHVKERFSITILLAFISRSYIRYVDEERNVIVPKRPVLRTNVVLPSSNFTNAAQMSFKQYVAPGC